MTSNNRGLKGHGLNHLGGGFKIVFLSFHPYFPGEVTQFDEHIFRVETTNWITLCKLPISGINHLGWCLKEPDEHLGIFFHINWCYIILHGPFFLHKGRISSPQSLPSPRCWLTRRWLLGVAPVVEEIVSWFVIAQLFVCLESTGSPTTPLQCPL